MNSFELHFFYKFSVFLNIVDNLWHLSNFVKLNELNSIGYWNLLLWTRIICVELESACVKLIRNGFSWRKVVRICTDDPFIDLNVRTILIAVTVFVVTSYFSHDNFLFVFVGFSYPISNITCMLNRWLFALWDVNQPKSIVLFYVIFYFQSCLPLSSYAKLQAHMSPWDSIIKPSHHQFTQNTIIWNGKVCVEKM